VNFFLPGLAQNYDPLDLSLQLAKIIGVSYLAGTVFL
jgi:hypothetical protein